MRIAVSVLAVATFVATIAGVAGAAPRLVVIEEFTNTS
jgi:hypothetical protein